MKESFEEIKSLFILPNIYSEEDMGELKRVAETFNLNIEDLLESAEAGDLLDLNEDIWSQLDNTDSNEVSEGDWTKVAYLSEQQDEPRDWKRLKNRLETGQELDAPIVLKQNDEYHLVSGNTRLMVARASGKTPKILLFEV